VYLDPERPVAKFVVQDRELVLHEGEWSPWVRVDFTAVPLLASVSAIGRFYLQQARPDFKLYVTPLQINPEDPALQISEPASWSHDLCENLGYFYTQELPADTKAFSGGIFTGREFWQQSQIVYEEQRRSLDYVLDRFEEGLLFFYFSSVDQGSHMLWRYADAGHPGFVADAELARGIETLYRQIDEAVGRALAVVDEDTTFVVMSDHGFGAFRRQVNLNTWLLEQGYVSLRHPERQEQYPLFADVDWSRTKAYALGLNGLYVNLKGRESQGIVGPEEYTALLDKLERELLELVDPQTGEHAVTRVVQSRRDFHGPFADAGPDIVVGYNLGYRSSWKSPLGEFPKGVFADNLDPWSGDHSVDSRHVPGVLITNRRITLERPALYDLTVAILDEYGVAKLPEMIGQDCLGPRPRGTAVAGK
jgi:predicted AlkP superfamily phosphohydrolase/phosphomutase